MSDPSGPRAGDIGWTDLTVEDAAGIREFYSQVVGWKFSPVPMGEYEDFAMEGADGVAKAGICHARGGNTGLPAQWLNYLVVDDIDASIERCQALGGEILSGPRSMGGARYCVFRDPAGAVAALYQPAGGEAGE